MKSVEKIIPIQGLCLQGQYMLELQILNYFFKPSKKKRKRKKKPKQKTKISGSQVFCSPFPEGYWKIWITGESHKIW